MVYVCKYAITVALISSSQREVQVNGVSSSLHGDLLRRSHVRILGYRVDLVLVLPVLDGAYRDNLSNVRETMGIL